MAARIFNININSHQLIYQHLEYQDLDVWVLWLYDGTHNVSMKCSTLLKIKMFYFQSNFSSPSPIYWTHKGGLLDVLVNFPDSAWQCQFHPSSTQYCNLDPERRDSSVENKPILAALCKYLVFHIIQQNLFILSQDWRPSRTHHGDFLGYPLARPCKQHFN